MGHPVEVLGWILVTIPAALLVIPTPWLFAAVSRWFCRNLVFSDRTTARFRGRGGEIFGWALLALLAGGIGVGPNIHIVKIDIDWWHLPPDPWMVVVLILLWMAGVLGQLNVIRWCVAKTTLSTEESFEFHGTYWELAGWEILNILAALTIIGWAWTTAAAYRWAAGNTRSEERGLAFHGEGFEILWRSFVLLFFCVPIVTIPWAILWYSRWLVSEVTLGTPEID